MTPSLLDRVRRDPMVGELARSSGVLYLAGGASVGLLLVQQLATARYLGAGDFGRLAAALGITVIAGLLVDIRSWELGTRLLAEPIDRGDVTATTSTFTWTLKAEAAAGAIGTLALCGGGPLVAWFVSDGHDVSLLLLLAPSVVLRQIAMGVSAATLRMLDRFNWIAARSVANAVLRLVLVAGPAFAGWGVHWVAAGMVVAEVFAAVSQLALTSIVYRSEHGRGLLTRSRIEDASSAKRLTFSLWLSATIKSLHIETFVPVAAAFTSAAQIGVLRAALDVGQVNQHATAPVTLVTTPKIVLLARSPDRTALNGYLRRVRALFVLLSGLAMLLGAVLVLFVVPALLGPGYDDIEAVGIIAVAGLGIAAATQWIRPLLVGLDRVDAQNRLGVVTGLVSILALGPVVSAFGAIGAAIDMLVFLTVYAALSLRIANRALHAH